MRLWLDLHRFLAQWLVTAERFMHSGVCDREKAAVYVGLEKPAASHHDFPVLTDGRELFHREEAG